ncbi:hypothetical protein [Sphingomonas sp. SUN039]|uniref:hypothetical protein n=1 Tax=Sphingomonas sp. SUN039 TaxID=2937787 RepID=UPI002164344F|nr:hypothetical protein [Sphingomonas sp. SUN039]UVO52945.1 hypothetical protein M0209_01965 [Sphingomonas sp. SUN039]
MNWRGISGIYAGFALVLGGAWLWMQQGSVWGLAVAGAGVVLAGASVVSIVLARRGPRPEKAAKPAKAVRGKAAVVPDTEADSIAKSRLAALAGRTSGRPVAVEPVELVVPEENQTDLPEASMTEAVETSPGIDTPELVEDAADAALPAADAERGFDEPGDVAVETAESDLSSESVAEPMDAWPEADLPEPVEGAFSPALPVAESEPGLDEVDQVEIEATDSEIPDELVAETHEAAQEADLPIAEAGQGFDELSQVAVEGADADPGEPGFDEISHVEVEATDSPAVALDRLPGFPWTARFIGLWSRDVRYACPDDLRGAVAHWQRWADTQASGAPIPEEASEEFQAMLAVWRECGADVPGLSSDDGVAVQLAEEAEYDAALAGLLPRVLRGMVSAGG